MEGTTSESLHLPSSSHLVLTLNRLLHHDMDTTTGANMEDPTRAGRTRSDAYRTLYIYSPKLKRDICTHSIKRDCWPQIGIFLRMSPLCYCCSLDIHLTCPYALAVVIDRASVAENNEQDYHFQVWLAGASPRQMDARTSLRFDQCQHLLWSLRKDPTTANVEIIIKDPVVRTTSKLGEVLHDMSSPVMFDDDTDASDGPQSKSRRNSNNAYDNHGNRAHLSPPSSRNSLVFHAHKCVLESVSFFSRMLNGNFMEAQADEKGRYRIELSSDMFDIEIMDHLLDYLYTREPIVDKCEEIHHPGCHQGEPSALHHGPVTYEPQVRHIISANVSLNLETIITETTIPNPLGRCRHRNHHQVLLPTAGLTLRHWGALYRAATHLEDKELQAQTLQEIQAHLDPETTLEQVLEWGHQHEEVRTVMMGYLIRNRREVFGNEQRNKLRPYLWAEYEEQAQTLVEITSRIARQ
ncbi:hypothetical protein BGX31_002007 [Mortierella sp. GBA43]|nr:hypothetical protein BGX31_002007 [Mortierella sp. GBA43]